MKHLLKMTIVAALYLTPLSTIAQAFLNYAQSFNRPYPISADSIIATGRVVPAAMLQAALSAAPQNVRIKLPKADRRKLSPEKLYEKARAATVVIGMAYRYPNSEQTQVHTASGYVIDKEGVIVTNYHVVRTYVDMKGNYRPLALLARLFDGKTYAVTEVLAASERDDLAILKLNTDGENLPTLPLSEGARIGAAAYVLSHPQGLYYFFTQGHVTSKFQEALDRRDPGKGFRDIMAISADYASGSSGAPVLDVSGNIIGTVQSTRTLVYLDAGKSVQMVLKSTIPVESLLKMVDNP